MPILTTDIKFYKSTGGLGGAITVTEITSGNLHDLFDEVSSPEALAGDTEYRCIYAKNTHGTLSLTDAVAYILSASSNPENTISIGAGTSAVNDVEQVIGNEGIVPTGVVFQTSTGSGNSVVLGTLPAGEYKAIWLGRLTASSAAAVSNASASIEVEGDTVG